MTFIVRDLIEGRPAPVCVKPTDSVQDALTEMIEYKYSQLPVVNDECEPVER